MKTAKSSLIVVGAVLFISVWVGVAYAFHSEGVGECGGCHSMHAPKTGAQYLWLASDRSSTCLACHAAFEATPNSYHVMTYPVPAAGRPPAEMSPAGDGF